MREARGAENRDRTILLVEDEAIIALSETMTLERHGCRVVTSATGERAVELAVSDPAIELVLMDINPGSGIDGTESVLTTSVRMAFRLFESRKLTDDTFRYSMNG